MAMKHEPSELCRDLNHTWAPYDAYRKGRKIARVLRCTRCNTLRRQWLSHNGEILGNTYTYVKGYMREGKGRMTPKERAALRVKNLDIFPYDGEHK